MNNIKSKIQFTVVIIAVAFLVHACANRGTGPTGGPKDTTPPKVMKSDPNNGALNFNKKQIQIEFDKMVSIEKPNENVIISPPQIKIPDIKAFGKKVIVNLNEDLQDNTTYSIDFGNGIVDLNEKNVIKNYLFAFSTGNQIDTLKVSGVVVDAENLNPLAGIIVGIYVESSDSVFFKKPFLRIGKTDEYGRFTINNMKNGTYKIFALGDANRDYFFQPGEGLAMSDSLIKTSFRREEMNDTIWKDSTTIDSIRKYMGTRFLPDDITLRYFKENKKRQYFVKSERKEPFVFTLFFNTSQKKLPEIKPLNFKWDGKYLLQKTAGLDSITYWITDTLISKIDTLQMAMTYQKTDSAFRLYSVTDTINVFMRKARANPKQKVVTPQVLPYRFTTNLSPTFEIYNPIMFNFETPILNFDVSKIKLTQKIDTAYKQIPFKWRQVDSTKMTFAIDYKWVAEKSYRLSIDSAVFTSIYQKVSSKLKTDFKIRSLDEYSSIKLIIEPFNAKAVIQVLGKQDEVIATKPALEKGTSIQYLKPGEYYIRMFIDQNGNGKWDAGDISLRRQPEEVFYYNKKLNLKANWDFEETWDYNQVSLLKQKPIELIKASLKKY